jgi:RNA polymerase sigma factor (sigma-70 family)
VSNITEQELIKACVQGDERAQKRLYDQYSRIMFGICLRYSNTYDEAKDVLQDGFVKVFTKMGQFGFQGSFEGWMKRIFVNTALEYYRSNKHHMYHEDVTIASEQPHHDHTIDKMSRKEILEIMHSLAPGYRNVLNLYIIEGYSHAEIGEMLGINEGTSKSQLSRARIILQQAIINRQKAGLTNE